ncbi:MAG: hypothetical protein ACRC68_07185 [Clostridium sp.]
MKKLLISGLTALLLVNIFTVTSSASSLLNPTTTSPSPIQVIERGATNNHYTLVSGTKVVTNRAYSHTKTTTTTTTVNASFSKDGFSFGGAVAYSSSRQFKVYNVSYKVVTILDVHDSMGRYLGRETYTYYPVLTENQPV